MNARKGINRLFGLVAWLWVLFFVGAVYGKLRTGADFFEGEWLGMFLVAAILFGVPWWILLGFFPKKDE